MSPRIARLRRDLRAALPGALENFWREVTAAGTPLVEPFDGDTSLVTFLWRGQARSTSVAWGVDVRLLRIPDTDVWYGSQTLPADLRTIYHLAHDGADSIPTDPRGEGPSHIDAYNPHPFTFPGDPDDPTDHDQWLSLLQLPAAPNEEWTAPRAGVARGSMLHANLASVALDGPRRVSMYRPADIPTDGLPTLVVFDGFLSRTVLKIPTTLDNLIAAGRVPPLVALFVSSPNDHRREEELRPGQSIVDFTTRELMPWARRQWRISEDPKDRAIAGASRGGLAAAYVALRAPDVFGAVISQSGSFWWPSPQEGQPEWLIREYAKHPRAPLRFYLDVGSREDIPGPGGAPSQLLVNRRMRDTLRDRGYPVVYAEYTGGHDYVNWRRTFADALIAVFGVTQAGREDVPGSGGRSGY
jgi:enterochelin esterase-like enzyme